MAERFERLEETLQIAHQMWSSNDGPFAGHHYRLAETLCVPPPVSQPRPRILIGGIGERKTLRFVARYADACNLFEQIGFDALRHKLDVLKRHCEDAGRDYADIEKTTLGTVHLAAGKQSAADLVSQCRALADLGIDQAIFSMPNVHEMTPLEVVAKEVIPAIEAF
jgi:alkanesulfonate monooxygenase SsuD/methylene tetrahydromethanopterin reductase-like flavin-dependent oxidoreductase (luciferase family)